MLSPDFANWRSPFPLPEYENIYLAKVLFLNDRPAEAVDMLARSPNGDAMAFEVLAAQTKYKEALNWRIRPRRPTRTRRPRCKF